MNHPPRVRFAPSPTGFLHVGGARTLLFNYLYARRHSGQLILRIEDTDQSRSTPQSEELMIADMASLVFDFDEGPREGGPYGPYRQSERLGIYAQFAKKLLDSQQAYFCFCSEELLESKRQHAMKLSLPPHYDGSCARLDPNSSMKRVNSGERAGLRFKVPERSYVLQDLVRGEVEFQSSVVGDFFVTRTPRPEELHTYPDAHEFGFPVYNFCCAVDDHLMQITHVIRAEEHLSNTLRQVMLGEALGFSRPHFAHISLVLGPDRQKLSKRSADVAVGDYLKKGYLPQVIINFIALIGWWPPADFLPQSGHPEILSRNELIQTFNLEGLHKSSGVFDVQKLDWMNRYYIHHMPIDELATIARPFFAQAGLESFDETQYRKVLETFRGEATTLVDLPRLSTPVLREFPEMDAEAQQALSSASAKSVLDALLAILGETDGELTEGYCESLAARLKDQTGCKGKLLFQPLRAVGIGSVHGPEIHHLYPILGRTRLITRINTILAQHGGASSATLPVSQ